MQHMKILFFVISIFVNFHVLACSSGKFERHINPDGTLGGLVSRDASGIFLDS
jgi:hypothetical protein